MTGYLYRDSKCKSNFIFNADNSTSGIQTFSAEAADPCASGVLYIRPHPVRGDDMFQYSTSGSSWSNIGDKLEEGGSKVGIVGSAEERAKSKAGAAGWSYWDDAKTCITEATACPSGSDGIVIFKSGNKFGLLNKDSQLLGWENSLQDAKLHVGGKNSCYIDRTTTSATSIVTVYDYDKFVNSPEYYTTGEGSSSYTPPAEDEDEDEDEDEAPTTPLTGQVNTTQSGVSPVMIGAGVVGLIVVVMAMKS